MSPAGFFLRTGAFWGASFLAVFFFAAVFLAVSFFAAVFLAAGFSSAFDLAAWRRRVGFSVSAGFSASVGSFVSRVFASSVASAFFVWRVLRSARARRPGRTSF